MTGNGNVCTRSIKSQNKTTTGANFRLVVASSAFNKENSKMTLGPRRVPRSQEYTYKTEGMPLGLFAKCNLCSGCLPNAKEIGDFFIKINIDTYIALAALMAIEMTVHSRLTPLSVVFQTIYGESVQKQANKNYTRYSEPIFLFSVFQRQNHA